MKHLNKITLIGNLGAEPEMKYTPAGKANTTCRLATDYVWGKGEDQKKETTWHTLEFWGPLAEIANQYLKKGSPVYIEGRQVHQQYTDGQGQKKYFAKVIVNEMIMLGNGGNDTRLTTDAAQEEEVEFSIF